MSNRTNTNIIERPAHYNSHSSGVECYVIAQDFGYILGNAVKYIWRAGLKSPNALEDLKKARWYVNKRIEQLENEAKGDKHGKV